MSESGRLFDSEPSDAAQANPCGRERILDRPCECECGCGQPLTGNQQRFASRLCSTRYWDQQHPRIGRGPAGPREGTILHAVLALMQDGQYRTALEIGDAVRAREHSVSARLSQIRQRCQAGLLPYRVESDAACGNSRRAHRFRLVKA